MDRYTDRCGSYWDSSDHSRMGPLFVHETLDFSDGYV